MDNDLFSPISLWWEAVPFALGGFSELFINVPGMCCVSPEGAFASFVSTVGVV